jgi:predicted transposase/invertase (TIGR01784 family)
MKHLAVLQINLRVRQNKTKDQREVIMNLSPVYEKWREETLTEGKQEGRQEERQSLALKMLEANAAVEFVAQITGYSIAEVQQLQAK